MPLLALLSPRIWAGIGLALAVAAGALWLRHTGTVAGRAEVQARWDVERAAQAETTRLREMANRKTANTATASHESDKTRIQTEFLTITERVNHETEKPVYLAACFPDTGLRELRAAIDAANGGDTAVPVKPVSAASASR